jgi:4,5-dihydroxyphthalate decarboxylase
MTMTSKPLTVAVGDPDLFGRIVAERSGVQLDLQSADRYVENLLRMSRSAEFDICEMPLVSLLQGASVGVPIRALPVVMLRRTPHLYWVAQRPAPADLAGIVTGVRSFAQTTGVWLRAALLDQHGLELRSWVTTEEERYPTIPTPPGVRHVPDPRGVAGLLEGGLVQAIVAPSSDTGSLQPLLEHPVAQGREWAAAFSITPINHVLICSEAAASERLDEVLEICAALRDYALGGASQLPWAAGDDGVASRPADECFDRDQILGSVDYLNPRAVAQGVLPAPVDLRGLFAAEAC